MAVVPQETQLAFEYSVIEVVLMGRYPHLGAFEIEGPADFAIARDALAATDTLALEDRAFGTLSGGEKQRVIIAAALAQIRGRGRRQRDPAARRANGRPSISRISSSWGDLLRDLQRRRPMAIAVSTHVSPTSPRDFAVRSCC